MQDCNTRLKYAKEIWNDIMSSPVHWFSSFPQLRLPEEAGVYIIWLKDPKEALYVGRTTNIHCRIYTNHLMGNESTARLKKYLVEDEELPNIDSYEEAKQYIKDNCCFQYIPIEDSNERGYVEGLLSFLTKVRYIQKER